ncbi:MAG TPA: hypothetical protein DCS93_44660 [Microscillaceae bacterium]|nr:hypothetical protein [Microscillaceae bacterium]
MNSSLFFKTLCLVSCISSVGFAQPDTTKSDHNYRSLWIGTEVIRSLIIFNPNVNNQRENKALELNVDYGITPTLRTYLYAGYASLEGRVRRNLDYWNESFYTRAGIKYSPKGRKGRVMAGVGLIYYALHETGGFNIGGSYFGDNILFPYNIWLTGLGLEALLDFRIPLFANLDLKFDFSVNVTVNPALNGLRQDEFSRNGYYVPGVGLATLEDSPQYNINLGIGLIYRIDWLRKK